MLGKVLWYSFDK